MTAAVTREKTTIKRAWHSKLGIPNRSQNFVNRMWHDKIEIFEAARTFFLIKKWVSYPKKLINPQTDK